MTVAVPLERETTPTAVRHGSALRLLALASLALVVTHWLRLLPLGFAAPGATRYEDFVDLLTPYAVAGPALAALSHVGASRRAWVLALLGTAMFVQGHGVHLSANSISHARGPAAPVYLWDEQVGHTLWFLGLAVLVGVVAVTVRTPGARPGLWTLALAGLVGLTWAANVVEAGVVPLGAGIAAVLVGLGQRSWSTLAGRLLAAAFALSLVLMAVYGLWQGGFPQPSELGWLDRRSG